MNKPVVTLLIVCGVLAGTVSQSFAQGATWADRGYINVGWGVESGTSTMTDTRTATVYEETATFGTTSEFTSGSLFDVGVGLRIWKNLTVGVAYHQEQNDTEAQITGSVPSPVFFNRPRTLAATEPLDRKEAAVHANLGWVLALNDKFDVMISGGPSFFRLTQEVVSAVQQNETAATATTVGATIETEERKKSVTGFNVGLDATYIVWSNDSVRVGAGGFFRFATAETELDMLSTSQPTKVGGTQFGLGVRLRF
ncbi:MAG TPA: hypothetical protein VNT81_15855 [Vicinamibacterales bacterium]|nr:hypothetical protein [Vicinamibacterales bacterium]